MSKEKVNAQLRKAFDDASELALSYVDAAARELLDKHDDLDEFAMGMGTWFFVDKSNNIIHSEDEPDYIANSDLAEFISVWDEYIGITGNPMKIRRGQPTLTEW